MILREWSPFMEIASPISYFCPFCLDKDLSPKMNRRQGRELGYRCLLHDNTWGMILSLLHRPAFFLLNLNVIWLQKTRILKTNSLDSPFSLVITGIDDAQSLSWDPLLRSWANVTNVCLFHFYRLPKKYRYGIVQGQVTVSRTCHPATCLLWLEFLKSITKSLYNN